MRIALFEPDIPQNTGAVLRLAACFGVPVDIVEPMGFLWSDRHLRRAGMDYAEYASVARYASWNAYLSDRPAGRIILLTTRASHSYADFFFRRGDILLLGSESCGVPGFVHEKADACLRIPIVSGLRSLNVALAAAIVTSEALRQTGGLPAT